LTDSHSNAGFRVNGPLSNLPQFAKAFGCKQRQQWSEKIFVKSCSGLLIKADNFLLVERFGRDFPDLFLFLLL
jgi:hypothetical protein